MSDSMHMMWHMVHHFQVAWSIDGGKRWLEEEVLVRGGSVSSGSGSCGCGCKLLCAFV